MAERGRRAETPASPLVERCSCAEPVVVVRAERKGAAASVCARCGRPIRLSLPA